MLFFFRKRCLFLSCEINQCHDNPRTAQQLSMVDESILKIRDKPSLTVCQQQLLTQQTNISNTNYQSLNHDNSMIIFSNHIRVIISGSILSQFGVLRHGLTERNISIYERHFENTENCEHIIINDNTVICLVSVLNECYNPKNADSCLLDFTKQIINEFMELHLRYDNIYVIFCFENTHRFLTILKKPIFQKLQCHIIGNTNCPYFKQPNVEFRYCVNVETGYVFLQ